MKICRRGLNFIQVIDAYGSVRICGWMRDCCIGSLLESSMEEIYHGELAESLRKSLIDQTYEYCPIDNCPYLANGTIEKELVDIEEIPACPTELYLAYEGRCNYDCTCCTSHGNMASTREHAMEFEANYDRIEEKLKELLPHIQHLGAHGRGELFASPRILKVLSEWRPLAPPGEISVKLETNGSLFDETHWKQIENLGQYQLRVAITVMSFDEPVYQYLSGVSYPISRLIQNLHFVKGLREKGIINELELATVLQEQNFREMPEFTRRCLEEFGADRVRIRPIVPGGRLDEHEQWFMNVRNPEHPYYREYRKVMEEGIFQDPRVLLWSGNLDAARVSISSLVNDRKSAQMKNRIADLLAAELKKKDFAMRFLEYLEKQAYGTVGVWGMGRVGKELLDHLPAGAKQGIRLYDKALKGKRYGSCVIEEICPENLKGIDLLIITPVECDDMVRSELDFGGDVKTLEDILKEL